MAKQRAVISALTLVAVTAPVLILYPYSLTVQGFLFAAVLALVFAVVPGVVCYLVLYFLVAALRSAR